MEAKDFLGKPINIGDEVVFMQLNYRNLIRGKIRTITPKTVMIDHEQTNTCSKETKQFHHQVIVVTSITTKGVTDV